VTRTVHLVTVPEEASAKCAELLREALAIAEAGRMRAVCIVTMEEGREVGNRWSAEHSFMELVGALTVAQRDIIEDASKA
jgi:hypothetical protein